MQLEYTGNQLSAQVMESASSSMSWKNTSMEHCIVSGALAGELSGLSESICRGTACAVQVDHHVKNLRLKFSLVDGGAK